MFRKIWLGLAEAITVLVMVLFIIGTLKPQWSPFSLSDWAAPRNNVRVKPADPDANLDIKQAPVNIASLSFHEAVNKAIPSVVRIYPSAAVQPNVGAPVERGTGSGVVIDKQGYIATNLHVIEGANDIQVILNDDRTATASLVGIDPDNDLAILKIELPNLTPIIMGREEDLRVGDVVLAIGNPFDVGVSVSMGIVSAKGRSHVGVNNLENFIQTDAAINQGNSGGALINTNGHLVGINEFIFNNPNLNQKGNVGVGFAIPVSTLQQVAQEIIKTGRVSRGYVGISSQNITPQMAKAFNLPNANGVIVSNLVPQAPAAQAGVQVGDILLKINDVTIKDVDGMIKEIAQSKPGDILKIQLSRKGQSMEVRAIPVERPDVSAIP